MSNQTKKKEELDSLSAFLKYCTDPFAKKLRECQNISAPGQERPDILLADEHTVYGIECIHIPLCREGPGDADMVQKAREQKTFNKYRIDEEKGTNKLEGHEEDAKKDIENIVDKKLESIREFSHQGYIQNCRELLNSHDAVAYRSNIADQYPGYKCDILFLLDISHPDMVTEFEYYHLRNGRKERGVRKDYPFTSDFLWELKRVPKVDRFLLVWHPERTYVSQDTRCYVLDPAKEWNKQSLMVWHRFEFPEEYNHPWSLKLSIVKEEQEDTRV